LHGQRRLGRGVDPAQSSSTACLESVVQNGGSDARFPDDCLDALHTYGALTSAGRRAVGG